MAYIDGIGIDIVPKARIAALIESRSGVFKRLLTDKEMNLLDKCTHLRSKTNLSGSLFALKEAVLKVYGTGWQEGISWQDIEIHSVEPVELKITGRLSELSRRCGIENICATVYAAKEHIVAQAIAYHTSNII